MGYHFELPLSGNRQGLELLNGGYRAGLAFLGGGMLWSLTKQSSLLSIDCCYLD